MCFSAAGSFTLSGILAVTGVAATTRNPSRGHRLFAAIPLVFALQQAAEGVVWLTIGDPGQLTLHRAAVNLFLGVAVVIWPAWCPLSLRLAESDPRRQQILTVMCLIGAGVSGMALFLLTRWQPIALVAGHSIRYVHQDDPLGRYSLLIYTLVTVAPFFVSTSRLVRLIGVAFLVSLVVTFLVERDTLTSVWCFFAAAISGLILLAILRLREPVGGSPDIAPQVASA